MVHWLPGQLSISFTIEGDICKTVNCANYLLIVAVDMCTGQRWWRRREGNMERYSCGGSYFRCQLPLYCHHTLCHGDRGHLGLAGGRLLTNHMDLLCNSAIYLTAAVVDCVWLIISIHNKFAMNIPMECCVVLCTSTVDDTGQLDTGDNHQVGTHVVNYRGISE